MLKEFIEAALEAEMEAHLSKDEEIACTDNLTGFSQAILSVYPKADIQTCIIHPGGEPQIRSSLKYMASKDQKEFMKDLMLVY